MARHTEATDLPEDIARAAKAQVAGGRFASVEDVVRAGVEALLGGATHHRVVHLDDPAAGCNLPVHDDFWMLGERGTRKETPAQPDDP
jgi:Arc/MetJ-type ribon-helix-helix transcriptional regulator